MMNTRAPDGANKIHQMSSVSQRATHQVIVKKVKRRRKGPGEGESRVEEPGGMEGELKCRSDDCCESTRAPDK